MNGAVYDWERPMGREEDDGHRRRSLAAAAVVSDGGEGVMPSWKDGEGQKTDHQGGAPSLSIALDPLAEEGAKGEDGRGEGTLRDIRFELKKGELLGICGEVRGLCTRNRGGPSTYLLLSSDLSSLLSHTRLRDRREPVSMGPYRSSAIHSRSPSSCSLSSSPHRRSVLARVL